MTAPSSSLLQSSISPRIPSCFRGSSLPSQYTMVVFGYMPTVQHRKRLASDLRVVLHRAISQRRYFRIQTVYHPSQQKLHGDQVIKATTWFTPDPSKVVSENVFDVCFGQQKTDPRESVSNRQTYSHTSKVVAATLH